MIWSSASEFWSMGGYGVYVWGSMGVSAALMALEVMLTRWGRQQALDAVCEAMEAQTLDAETVRDPVASSSGTTRQTTFNPGAVT
jgi:heme exporter protein D